MDVTERIKYFMTQRGWSVYRLGKKSGLAQSTLSHIFSKDSEPTISTLETICSTFGITMGEFFSDGELVPLTDEQRNLLHNWSMLTNDQKQLILNMMQSMK